MKKKRLITLCSSMIVGALLCSSSLVRGGGPPETGDSEIIAAAEELAAARHAQEDYGELQKALVERLRAAPSDVERQALERSLRDAESDYRKRTKQAARRLLDLVQNLPAGPDGTDALTWVAQHGDRPQAGAAMDMLVREHLGSDKLSTVCQSLADADREDDLRKLMAHSPHKNVRAFACYELAGCLKRRAEANPSDRERLRPEIDALLEQLADEHADVEHPFWKRTLGELGRNELFERRNLIVGAAAPEIEGKDADERHLKLGDFRGKVVLLEFWGFS